MSLRMLPVTAAAVTALIASSVHAEVPPGGGERIDVGSTPAEDLAKLDSYCKGLPQDPEDKRPYGTRAAWFVPASERKLAAIYVCITTDQPAPERFALDHVTYSPLAPGFYGTYLARCLADATPSACKGVGRRRFAAALTFGTLCFKVEKADGTTINCATGFGDVKTIVVSGVASITGQAPLYFSTPAKLGPLPAGF